MEDVSGLEFFLKMYSELYHENKVKSKEINRMKDVIKGLEIEINRLHSESEIRSKSFKTTEGYKHITEI